MTTRRKTAKERQDSGKDSGEDNGEDNGKDKHKDKQKDNDLGSGTGNDNYNVISSALNIHRPKPMKNSGFHVQNGGII